MKNILLLITLLASSALWAGEIYTANYDLYWGGMKIGTAERKLSKIGNTYSFSSVAKPQGLAKLLTKGLVETSKFKIYGKQLKSLEYFYDQRGKKNRKVKHQYKWSSKSLNITQPKYVKVNNIGANTVDLLSFQHLISMGLINGKRSFVGDVYKKSAKPDTYTLKARGVETVTTPAGKFKALKVTRTGSADKSFSLWCAKEFNYVPVKIEYATRKGDLARMMLTKIKFASNKFVSN